MCSETSSVICDSAPGQEHPNRRTIPEPANKRRLARITVRYSAPGSVVPPSCCELFQWHADRTLFLRYAGFGRRIVQIIFHDKTSVQVPVWSLHCILSSFFALRYWGENLPVFGLRTPCVI